MEKEVYWIARKTDDRIVGHKYGVISQETIWGPYETHDAAMDKLMDTVPRRFGSSYYLVVRSAGERPASTEEKFGHGWVIRDLDYDHP